MVSPLCASRAEIRRNHGLYERSGNQYRAGAKLDINTFAVIPTVVINTSSGGAEANPFSFELAYDTGGEAAYDMAAGERGSQTQPGVRRYRLHQNKPTRHEVSVIENCKELSYK